MIRQFIFTISLPFLLLSCSDGFKKAQPGLEYKIISHGESDPVFPGETIKMHIKQVYRDSVLNNTRDSVPFYQVYDSTVLSPESYRIFGEIRNGDSIIFKAVTDSAFKNKMPAFVKKNDYLYTFIKIIRIFGVKEDYRDDLRKEIELKRPHE